MATETVTWASVGSAGSWVASSGTLLACVQTESDGTHGIEPTSTSAMFGVPADFTAGAGETVNSVTIRAVMRVETAGDSCEVANMLRVGAGSNVTHATVHLVDATAFTEYEWVWTTQPSGAAWTVAAANDIARCYVDPALSALGGALHLDVIQVILDYGAAGTNYTQTPTDPVGVGDTAVPAQGFARAPADSAGVTDASTAVQDVVRAHGDSLGLTDAVQVTISATRTTADPVGVTDTDNPLLLEIGETQTDAVGLTDSVTATILGEGDTLADTIPTSDTTAITLDAARAAPDAVGTLDTVDVTTALVRTPADQLTLTDSVNVVLSRVLAVADTVAVTDLASPFFGTLVTPLERTSPVAAQTRVSAVAAQTRVTAYGGTMSNYQHDPDSILDYMIDWAALTNGTGSSDWLAEGETITASTWTVPAGITQTTPAPSNTDTTTTIWLTGGTVDEVYQVTNHITTNQGRQQDYTITLAVRER